jgi:hypothetical protein
MTGYTTTASGGRDIYTVQYSANGTKDWEAVYSGSGVLADEGVAATVDASGNVYVAGYTTVSGTNTDLIVIKYNSSGTQQWVRTMSGSASGGADSATSLALAGSDLVVAGYVTNATRDFFAAKITSANSVTWQNSYDAGGLEGGVESCTALLTELLDIPAVGQMPASDLRHTDCSDEIETQAVAILPHQLGYRGRCQYDHVIDDPLPMVRADRGKGPGQVQDVGPVISGCAIWRRGEEQPGIINDHQGLAIEGPDPGQLIQHGTRARWGRPGGIYPVGVQPVEN